MWRSVITIIIVWIDILISWLQRGGGAPARERVVSEDDQKAMMAFYYKKQEEMKVMPFMYIIQKISFKVVISSEFYLRDCKKLSSNVS